MPLRRICACRVDVYALCYAMPRAAVDAARDAAARAARATNVVMIPLAALMLP